MKKPMSARGAFKGTTVAPFQFQRTQRAVDIIRRTDARAGVLHPLAFIPLFPEDSFTGTVSCTIEMEPAVKPLDNGILCGVRAVYVPFAASERFHSITEYFNALAGNPEKNGVVTPWQTQIAMTAATPPAILAAMGYQVRTGNKNDFPIRAYNIASNMLWRKLGKEIPARTELDVTLARAPFRDPLVQEIVPDFDVSLLAGELDFSLSGQAPVSGIYMEQGASFAAVHTSAIDTVQTVIPANSRQVLSFGQDNANQRMIVEKAASGAYPYIRAELSALGGKINLAQLDQIQKTVAFAKYLETIEEQLGTAVEAQTAMDLLVRGLRIPQILERQPLLVGEGTSVIGYMTHRSTEAASLNVTRTTGMAQVNVRMNVPQQTTGGMIMLLADFQPERHHERAEHPWWNVLTPNDIPDAARDTMAVQPVDIINNHRLDSQHASPTVRFGYAGRNRHWQWPEFGLGGRAYRKALTDENKMSYWAVDVANPTLSTSWYLMPMEAAAAHNGNNANAGIHHYPFADTTLPPFKIVTRVDGAAMGLTQFGPILQEDRSLDEEVELIEDLNPPLIA